MPKHNVELLSVEELNKQLEEALRTSECEQAYERGYAEGYNAGAMGVEWYLIPQAGDPPRKGRA
jgi:flagellar biosynthesis/type III secretory pathway protein FliH